MEVYDFKWAILAWSVHNGMTSVEIQLPRHIKISFILCGTGVYSPLRLWMLDTDTGCAEIPGRVLHQNVTRGPEHQPGREHHH